ncbi:hypothetical protein [Aquisediminimonas profunda]|uniref:hypothetical protein n=1 Tax=Aquisediminimonas profunda TaxID=1550733 RepID=UPI001C634380|nr:hypothetical protein [Aquisediminimonas profunda]
MSSSPALPYVRRVVRPAFLAPDLQRATPGGRQPPSLTLKRLMYMDMPFSLTDQKAKIARV